MFLSWFCNLLKFIDHFSRFTLVLQTSPLQPPTYTLDVFSTPDLCMHTFFRRFSYAHFFSRHILYTVSHWLHPNRLPHSQIFILSADGTFLTHSLTHSLSLVYPDTPGSLYSILYSILYISFMFSFQNLHLTDIYSIREVSPHILSRRLLQTCARHLSSDYKHCWGLLWLSFTRALSRHLSQTYSRYLLYSILGVLLTLSKRPSLPSRCLLYPHSRRFSMRSVWKGRLELNVSIYTIPDVILTHSKCLYSTSDVSLTFSLLTLKNVRIVYSHLLYSIPDVSTSLTTLSSFILSVQMSPSLQTILSHTFFLQTFVPQTHIRIRAFPSHTAQLAVAVEYADCISAGG